MQEKMQHPKSMNMRQSHYARLFAMTIASFIAMYFLMYAMVDRLDNVVPNYNQFYMAGLMTAPMVVLELILMGGMYPNKKLNGALIAVGIAALALFWVLIRQQAAIDDRQFLKSMIPHHAGAILMCEQARIARPEVRQLCGEIESSQASQIALMKSLLEQAPR